MKTRKRGGGKEVNVSPAKSVKKKVQNNPDSVIIPSKFNDSNLSLPKDSRKTKFNNEVINVINRNPYYVKGRQTDITTTKLSDEEFTKRFNAAETYHKLYNDTYRNPRNTKTYIKDKTVNSNKFSTPITHKKYITILNNMKKNNIETIKEKIKANGVREITDSDIRAIAKQHCDDNERPEIAQIISKFSEAQRDMIINTINENAKPDENGEESQGWCNIMGGKRNPKRKTRKRTRTRRKTRRRKTKRRRNLS